MPTKETAFWQFLGADAASVPERRQQTTIAVHTLDGCQDAALREALEGVGVRLLDEQDASLTVVVTDDYMRPELATINRESLAAGQPWMPVKLVGNVIWLGPLFEPGSTACWACLAQRLEDNRQVETFLLRRSGRTSPLPTARSALDPTVRLGANLAATEILKWIVLGKNDTLRDQVLTIDVLTAESRKHTLVRRPQCPLCGDPDVRAAIREPRPIALSSNKKRFRNDGGHRTLFPEEVYDRYKHHISPITGVINSLTDFTENVNGLTYSFRAVHPFPVVRDDVSVLRQNLRGRSGGKGMTSIQARVSGLGEAFERYSGVYRADEDPSVRATFRDLGDDAIDLQDCLLFSERQYASRQQWNARQGTQFHLIPNPLDKDTPIEWSHAWSLTHQRFRYIPTVYAYYGHPDLKHFFCGSDANGCSAGHTLEEAILQGFLELVERDGVAMWWYNQARRPVVDVESFDIPYFRVLQSYYRQIDRDIWVLDLTTDLQIPIFAAVSRRIDRPIEDIIVGFGAHLDPKIAILRALTEANQFLPVVLEREADGSTRYLMMDAEMVAWLTKASIAQQAYLAPDPAQVARTAANYPRIDNDDLLDDVQICVARAQEAGLETLVIDQTRPDVGMKVCRVIVPGLRHFWRRLGPGRLYEIPVKLGWQERQLTEDELNPFSMFF